MKNRFAILLLLMAGMISVSCVKEKLELTYTKQEDSINKYIEAALSKDENCTTVNNGGSNRLTLVQGEGEELKPEGSLTFYYAGYTFSGSVNPSDMFTTNREASANDAGWDLTDGEYDALTLNLADDRLIPGLKMGLEGVKAGEECEIIFTGKYGFGNKTFGMIPANSALLYKIWVVSISNE